ncbi:hypothetical protein [Telluria beijingensis]|uniref:hypothetical protein n=1 Tax=Telluria beijingensis TaxID=3068633 RepID=UPI003BF5C671
MDCLIDYCRGRSLLTLRGSTLAGNTRMHSLARACGFTLMPASDGAVERRLGLKPAGDRECTRADAMETTGGVEPVVVSSEPIERPRP